MATTGAPPRGTAIAAVVSALVFGAGLGALRFVNQGPVERSAQTVGDLAFAVVFLAPGLLGLLALRRGRALLLAAGALELALGLLSLLSLVGLVLFVPMALFFAAGGRSAEDGVGATRTAAAVVTAVVLGLASFFALFRYDDPVCWAAMRNGSEVRLDPGRFVHGTSISGTERVAVTPGMVESGCSSDSISRTEAATSMTLTVVMLLAAWTLVTPRPAPIPSASTD